MITTTAAVTALADALTVADGGFTVSLPDGHRPTDGYVLSIYPDREVKFHGTPRAADLVAYANDHADILRQRGAYFGGWHDPATHAVYLDVCVWVPDRATAERLARAAGQLAYFDVTAARSVALAPILI
jgi:hypothetical protein